MKTSLAIQCVVLLVCMALCSSLVIPKCRCLKNSKGVNPSLIAAVQELGVRPYCNKREVIVRLKDGNERCLDPEAPFTKALLQRINQMKSGHKVAVSSKTSTGSNTGSNTAAPTVPKSA